MPTRLRSKCPRCQQTLKVDDSMLGRNVRCPACENQFVLSSFSGGESEPAAVSISGQSAQSQSPSSDSNGGPPSDTSRSRYRGDSEATMGRIGRFELKAVLGHGGFGRVFRAYDPQLDRQVALKVPKFAPEEKKKIRRFLA